MKIFLAIVKIAIAGFAIGLGLLAVWPVSAELGTLLGDRQLGLSLIGLPLNELVKIVPALVLGWTVKRHPLLWGAGAGVIGAYIQQNLISGMNNYAPASAVGTAVALVLITSIAAFTGRGLRHRLMPPNNSFNPMPLRGTG